MMTIIGGYEVVSEGQQLVSNGALAGMSGLGTAHFLLAVSGPSLRFFSMNQQNKEYAKVSRDSGWLFCFDRKGNMYDENSTI